MEVSNLISLIEREANCEVLPPSVIPLVRAPLVLPDDVRAFYERCGGSVLFGKKAFGFRIMTPEEFVPANPVLLGEYYSENKDAIDSDISAGWYIIAQGTCSSIEYITIDLNAAKNGFCYDSFWDVHATGNAKIVAKSFAELIERLYSAKGEVLYWEHRSFNLGYAYG